MVKPRRGQSQRVSCSSSSSNESFEFFKVFLPDQSSHQLKIPPAFVKHFKGFLPRKCIIKNQSNEEWSVHLRKEDSNVIFKKGWQKFVEDYCLEFGDFLIFRYDGTSEIYVKVYSNNGCEKEESMTELQQRGKRGNIAQQKLVSFLEKKKAFMHLHYNYFNAGKCTQLRCRKSVARHISHTTVLVSKQHNDRPQKAGIKFQLKNFHFKVVMQTSYIKNYILNIPLSFLKKCIEPFEEGQQDIMLQMSNRSWIVNMITHKSDAKLSRGWAAFARANSLQAGDICSFHLINSEHIAFEVTIIRGPDQVVYDSSKLNQGLKWEGGGEGEAAAAAGGAGAEAVLPGGGVGTPKT